MFSFCKGVSSLKFVAGILDGNPRDSLFLLSVSGLQDGLCCLLLGFKVQVDVRSFLEGLHCDLLTALCVVVVAPLLSLIVPYKDAGLEQLLQLVEFDSTAGQEVLRFSRGAVPSFLSRSVPARLTLGLNCGLALGDSALLALEGRVRNLSFGEEGRLERLNIRLLNSSYFTVSLSSLASSISRKSNATLPLIVAGSG